MDLNSNIVILGIGGEAVSFVFFVYKNKNAKSKIASVKDITRYRKLK